MVKIIQLQHVYNAENLLGKFLDDDAYDIVLNEDTDVYKPLGIGEEPSENNILLKFRKGAFNRTLTKAAYEGLRSGATLTDNRGLAAGAERTGTHQKLPSGQGSRRWVTKREKAVIEYFAKGSPTSLWGDLAQEIYDAEPNTPLDGRGGGTATDGVTIKGGAIWIVKLAHEIDFDEWFKATIQLSAPERVKAAVDLCGKYISDTTYGEGVHSGVGGFMDRYPRIPFCRQTAWTAANPEKFDMALPLMEKASRDYASLFPIRWAGQYEAANKLDNGFRIGDTVYTTVTINKTFRTACHRDAGDLCDDGIHQANPRGFSNLTVVTNGKAFDGFYLSFPEYRVAANIQDGDFIMMDAHKIHGNTPLKSCDEGFERLSLVLYMREPMLECESLAMETARKNFVYGRKNNPEHPEWKISWNGVSPNCFFSQEWKDYLFNNGFPEEASKIAVI